MEEELRRIKNWASHGTLRQFYTEVSAKVSGQGYEVELEGDTLTCYRIRKVGGFLGIGAKRVREPVLKVIRKEEEIIVPEDSADEEFVHFLASSLKQH